MKNILQENMRRFGTKNLSEQTTQTNLTPDELTVLGLVDLVLSNKHQNGADESMEQFAASVARNKNVAKLGQDLLHKKNSGSGSYDNKMFQVMLTVAHELYPTQNEIDNLIDAGTNLKTISYTTNI